MPWHMSRGATRATQRKLHAAIARSAAAAALLAFTSLCPAQPAVQSPQDPAVTQIVALESLAATAVGEGHIAAAIDDHSRALQVAETLQRPRLVAVLLTRLGLLYEDDNKIQRGLIAHELALKALDRDADLDLSPVIQRLGSGRKGFDARPEPVSADLYRESVARDLDAEEQDPALPVKVLINIGNGYLRQPQDEAALRAYRLALEQPEIAGAPLQKAHALANSGEILRRPGQARRSPVGTRRCLGSDRARRQTGRRAPGAGIACAHRRAALGCRRRARAIQPRDCAVSRVGGSARGSPRAARPRLPGSSTQNRIQDASGAYQRALDLGTATNDEDVLWQSHWGLGRCAYARGESIARRLRTPPA